mmetsp:Transcript_54712/g.168522  ORF Transcript_54712/g.168522 Transcript_54712/m.168522 type:complete len:208 (+) Transcript_54712:3201-3824(+)
MGNANRGDLSRCCGHCAGSGDACCSTDRHDPARALDGVASPLAMRAGNRTSVVHRAPAATTRVRGNSLFRCLALPARQRVSWVCRVARRDGFPSYRTDVGQQASAGGFDTGPGSTRYSARRRRLRRVLRLLRAEHREHRGDSSVHRHINNWRCPPLPLAGRGRARRRGVFSVASLAMPRGSGGTFTDMDGTGGSVGRWPAESHTDSE